MRFITRTSLADLTPLSVNGQALLEHHARVHDVLRTHGGEAAARLFAQSVVTWGNGTNPGSVAWYTDALGEPGPLAALPAERREAIGQRLKAALTAVWPARTDPVVAAALTLAGPDSIWAVGDEAVIVGWGLTAANPPVPATPAELAATFGSYLPADDAIAPVPPPPPSSGPIPVPPPVSPPASVAPLAAAAPMAARSWLLPAGLALLAICLVLGLWAGLRLLSPRASYVQLADPATLETAIGLANAQNSALEAQIAAAQKSLASPVCPMPSAGPAAAPLTAPVAPAALPPTPQTPFHGSLLALLRQATVMVTAHAGPNRIVTGSGFFFAPNLVLTNRHVVQEAQGTIFVTNEALGHPVPATVVAETPNSIIFQPDFAVLQLAATPEIQPLAFTSIAEQLQPVIATGYPGAFLLDQGNDAYAQLNGVMQGDMTNMPAMIATEGVISAVQKAPSGYQIIPHTAQISSGDSGGPLVDQCGRVLGVNTFTRDTRQQIVHINYAQKIDQALAFLTEHQIAFTELKTGCQPAAAPAALPPSPTPPGAAPAAPAEPAAK
ncbi:MAG TPA: serine protease [Acetobacteraceae bacterium]|nr:serine protease [Acetobacteraceae bacterium]